MGAVERHCASPSIKTSELSRWICKVRVKKRNYKRKNLFIDVVLANALRQAEHMLHAKQQERRMRWEAVKSALVNESAALRTRSECVRADAMMAASEDLRSLDDFMYKLSLIKVPVQR